MIVALLGDRTPTVVFRDSRHAPKNAEREAVGLLAGQAPAAPPVTKAEARWGRAAS